MHNDCLLAPEKLAIPYEMLSNYGKEIADKYGIKVGDVKILIPNLGSTTNYEIHYRNLQLYLSLRMKLSKILKVLKFKRSDWMKKYTDFITEKRRNATTSFEKDVFKLMINSVYAKALGNLRKRINVRLVYNETNFLKDFSKDGVHTQAYFFNEDLKKSSHKKKRFKKILTKRRNSHN